MNLRFCIVAISICAACRRLPTPTPRVDASRTASGALTDRVPGCYELEDGDWLSDKNIAKFYLPQYLPRHFQFDTTKLQGWDPLQEAARPMWSLRARPLSASGYSPFTYWRRIGNTSDTIFVGAPLPLGGANMMLWPVADGFAGTLTTFTDAIPTDGIATATVPIRLHRSTCTDR